MPTCIELDGVHFLEGQLSLKLDLFELWEGEQGVAGEREISWLLLQGVCLCAFKGHSHLNGLLWLCSWVWFQRSWSCGIPLPIGPPLALSGIGLFCPTLWDLQSIPPGTLQLTCKNSNGKDCFKWSLLLLYKPSFKIDYKMFLNLPNTH